jgi:hypothetical protein
MRNIALSMNSRAACRRRAGGQLVKHSFGRGLGVQIDHFVALIQAKPFFAGGGYRSPFFGISHPRSQSGRASADVRTKNRPDAFLRKPDRVKK